MSAVLVLQVFLTQRSEILDPQGCASPNQNLVAALKASDQLESGLMRAYGYLDMCELANHSLHRCVLLVLFMRVVQSTKVY